MDSTTIDEAYFEWLLDQVRAVHGAQTYRELLWELYKKEYVWIVPNDDNRVADGLSLLSEFFRERGLAGGRVEIQKGCSCLELIVGVSRRLAFTAGGDPVEWAWHLLGNLGFHSMSDPLDDLNRETVDVFLERLIWRTFKADGRGGLFPLAFPRQDQRKVEIWYQMNCYIEETPTELHPL